MSGSSVEPSSSVEPVETTPAQPPLLRVVKGDPTPEQLAALVTVVSALAGGAAAAAAGSEQPRRSEWNAPHRAVRPPHRHGPGAWRASAR